MRNGEVGKLVWQHLASLIQVNLIDWSPILVDQETHHVLAKHLIERQFVWVVQWMKQFWLEPIV